MAWGLLNRSPFVVNVIRDRNPTFVALRDGSVRDGYTLKLSNRTFSPETFTITVDGLAGATLRTSGEDAPMTALQIQVPIDASRAVKVFVMAPADEARPTILPITFNFSADGHAVTHKSAFVSGSAR